MISVFFFATVKDYKSQNEKQNALLQSEHLQLCIIFRWFFVEGESSLRFWHTDMFKMTIYLSETVGELLVVDNVTNFHVSIFLYQELGLCCATHG